MKMKPQTTEEETTQHHHPSNTNSVVLLNKNTTNEEEITLRHVYGQCDPLIRQLCELIQTTIPLLPPLYSTSNNYDSSGVNHHHQHPSKKSTITNNNKAQTTTTTTTTTAISAIRQISNLCETLHQRIVSLSLLARPTTNNTSGGTTKYNHQYKYYTTALRTMLDYIMIPTISILRTYGSSSSSSMSGDREKDNASSNCAAAWWWHDDNYYHNNDNNHRQYQILQGMVWKCMIQACHIISVLVQVCFATDTNTDTTAIDTDTMQPIVVTSNRPRQPQQSQSADQRRLLSYLHACIVALPTRTFLLRQYHSVDDDNVGSSSSSGGGGGGGSTAVVSQLDNGDMCVSSILSTIQLLLRILTQSTTTAPNRHSKERQQQLRLPELCIVRILDTCITIIEPPTTTTTVIVQSSSSRQTGNNNNNNKNDSNEAISLKLQLQATEILHFLLQVQQLQQPENPSSETVVSSTKTTTSTAQQVPMEQFDWRTVFPGLYTGLFCRIIVAIRPRRSHTTLQQQQMTVLCLTITTKLLRRVCCCDGTDRQRRKQKNDGTNNDKSSSSSLSTNPAMVLHQLQALAVRTNNHDATDIAPNDIRNAKKEKSSTTTEQEQFMKQIRQRVPSTLVILINTYVRSVRTTPKIRQQILQLCRLVLMDTNDCWTSINIDSQNEQETKNRDLLFITSLEAVLIFVNDVDMNVANDARMFVMEYMTLYLNPSTANSSKDTINAPDHGHLMKCMIGPRMIESIVRLPSYIQGGGEQRDNELQYSLQLLLGYFQHLPKQLLRTSLTSESVVESIRQTFTNLFDVSFETSDPYQLGTIVLNFVNHHTTTPDTSTDTKLRQQFNKQPQRQYMSESQIDLTKEVVQTYGAIIGSRYVVMFVDSCIADLYRSCIDRIERHVSLSGRSHIQWIHEWIGTITFVQCIMHGSFFTPTTNDENSKLKSRSKYVKKYLLPLLRSILPIIASYPLWELSNHWSTSKECQTSRADDNFETSAFRGNVVMTCSLLEFVKTAIELLDSETIQEFNSIILYPLLDKMSEQYTGAVRETAYHALRALANTNCRNSDVVALIVNNIESCLIGPMWSRLRIPGGRSLQPDTPIDYDIICVLDCATTILRLTTEAYTKKSSVMVDNSMITTSILSSMEDLTMQLTKRFDYASTILKYDALACLRYLQLFDAAIGLLHVVYHPQQQLASEKEVLSVDHPKTINAPLVSPLPSSQINENDDNDPWFRLLAPYTKEIDDGLNAKEGFQKYWEEKDEMIRKQNIAARDHSESENTSTGSNGNGINVQRDVQFCSYVAWRLGYLLSHPNIQVQHRSCDVLMHCFQWLGFLATTTTNYNLSSDTTTSATNLDGNDHGAATTSTNQSPKTAILRQVHSSWPAISKRLIALSTDVTTNRETPPQQSLSSLLLLEISSPSSTSQSNDKHPTSTTVGVGNCEQPRVYLSKLLQLITVMMENTDDFMFSQFRTVIYPKCIVPLLQHYSNDFAPAASPSSSISRSTTLQQRRSRMLHHGFTKSDEELLYTVLDCTRRMYLYRPLGCIAINFIPSIGQYVISVIFQSNSKNRNSHCEIRSNTRIRTVGIDAIRMMIHIDPDALYRPLFLLASLSNRDQIQMIPYCPLIPNVSDNHNQKSTENTIDDVSDLATTSPATIQILPRYQHEQHISPIVTMTVPVAPTGSGSGTTATGTTTRIHVDVDSAVFELLDLIRTLPEQPLH